MKPLRTPEGALIITEEGTPALMALSQPEDTVPSREDIRREARILLEETRIAARGRWVRKQATPRPPLMDIDRVWLTADGGMQEDEDDLRLEDARKNHVCEEDMRAWRAAQGPTPEEETAHEEELERRRDDQERRHDAAVRRAAEER